MQTMRFTLLDVTLPLLGAISFVLLAWASLRRIYAGRELPGHMKKTLILWDFLRTWYGLSDDAWK